jgi:hypothetical protein
MCRYCGAWHSHQRLVAVKSDTGNHKQWKGGVLQAWKMDGGWLWWAEAQPNLFSDSSALISSRSPFTWVSPFQALGNTSCLLQHSLWLWNDDAVWFCRVPQPAWLSCWTWLGAMGNEKQRHTDIKTQSWDREDCMFLVGYVSTFPSQSVYFIG